MAHQHRPDHGVDSAGRGRRLLIATALNAGITVAELVGGLISGSLALLADAAHNLSDAGSILVAYIAWRISQRTATERYTFGYKRAETIGAVINLTALFVIGMFLLYEAVDRFFTAGEIDARIMLLVGVIALVEDALAAWVLSGDHGLNVRAAMIHMIADAAASIGVVLGALAIMVWGVQWIDPTVTVLIAIYALVLGYREIRKAIDALMDSPPPGFDLNALVRTLETTPGVEHVHHVHVWQPDEERTALEAHLALSSTDFDQATQLKEALKERIHREFGIDHATIEIEHAAAIDHGREVIRSE